METRGSELNQPFTTYLVAFNENGQLLFETAVPMREWYDEEQPLIDSEDTRVRLGIRRLEGRQTDASGNVDQSWAMEYDEFGKVTASRDSADS